MNERAGSMQTRVGLILLLALVLRCGAAFWWESRLPTGQHFAFGDSQSYWVLADQIANGKPYEYGIGKARVFRTPGYPLLLAPLFVFHEQPPVLWARWLGAVFGTLAVGGVIWIARQVFSDRAALIAGILAASYPGAIGMSVMVLSEAPFCALMVAQLAVWILAIRVTGTRPGIAWGLVAGGLAGLATLVRPSWLLFTPFALLITLLGFSQRRRHLMVGATIALGFFAAMLPWWLRNYRVTGTMTLTTTQLGASLYDGLNPHATGASDMRFVEHFYEQQRLADSQSVTPPTGVFEVRLDNRLRSAALAWAKGHPSRVLQLTGIKFARMWSPWPNASEFQSWTFRLAILVGYTPLLVLGIIGAARFARSSWPAALCVFPALYFTCLHVIFVSSIRYRQPAILVLIVLAAGLIDSWWTQNRLSKR